MTQITPRFNFNNPTPATGSGQDHEATRVNNNNLAPVKYNEYERVMSELAAFVGNSEDWYGVNSAFAATLTISEVIAAMYTALSDDIDGKVSTTGNVSFSGDISIDGDLTVTGETASSNRAMFRSINIPWANSRSYAVNDLVQFGTMIYACKEAHTSSSGIFTDDATYWDAVGSANLSNQATVNYRGIYAKLYSQSSDGRCASVYERAVGLTTADGSNQERSQQEQAYPRCRLDYHQDTYNGGSYALQNSSDESTLPSGDEDRSGRTEFTPDSGLFYSTSHARMGFYLASKGSGYTGIHVVLHDVTNSTVVGEGSIVFDNLTEGTWNYINLTGTVSTGTSYHYHIYTYGGSSVTDPTVGGTAATVYAIRELYLPTAGEYGDVTTDVLNIIDSSGDSIVTARSSADASGYNPPTGSGTYAYDYISVNFANSTTWENWDSATETGCAYYIGVDLATGRIKLPASLSLNSNDLYAEYNTAETLSLIDSKNILRHDNGESVADFVERTFFDDESGNSWLMIDRIGPTDYDDWDNQSLQIYGSTFSDPVTVGPSIATSRVTTSGISIGGSGVMSAIETSTIGGSSTVIPASSAVLAYVGSQIASHDAQHDDRFVQLSGTPQSISSTKTMTSPDGLIIDPGASNSFLNIRNSITGSSGFRAGEWASGGGFVEQLGSSYPLSIRTNNTERMRFYPGSSRVTVANNVRDLVDTNGYVVADYLRSAAVPVYDYVITTQAQFDAVFCSGAHLENQSIFIHRLASNAPYYLNYEIKLGSNVTIHGDGALVYKNETGARFVTRATGTYTMQYTTDTYTESTHSDIFTFASNPSSIFSVGDYVVAANQSSRTSTLICYVLGQVIAVSSTIVTVQRMNTNSAATSNSLFLIRCVSNINISGWTFNGRGNVNNRGGNITFSGYGGAFDITWCVNSRFDLEVTNCVASRGGAYSTISSSGNKLYTACYNLDIKNINNCSGTSQGGGIYNISYSRMSDITNCSANHGGGVCSVYHSFISDIHRCSANSCGGGIDECYNCNVYNIRLCQAGVGGGGIHSCYNSHISNIHYCQVYGSSSSDRHGGGIYYLVNSVVDTITNCKVINAGSGRALGGGISVSIGSMISSVDTCSARTVSGHAMGGGVFGGSMNTITTVCYCTTYSASGRSIGGGWAGNLFEETEDNFTRLQGNWFYNECTGSNALGHNYYQGIKSIHELMIRLRSGTMDYYHASDWSTITAN